MTFADPRQGPRASRRAEKQRRARQRRRIAFALIAVIVVVGAGFAAYSLTRTTGDTKHVAVKPRTTTTTLPPTSTTVPRDPRRGNGAAVTIAFGGDVHFEGPLRTKLLADPNTVMLPIQPVLSSADIAMVNLETAITEGGVVQPKDFNFRAPATALDALRAGGIDVATEANNHGEDYGPLGFADTLAARLAKQFPVVGIGANATEAYTPARIDVRGQRIALFGATDVLDTQYINAWTATDSQGGLASTKDDAQNRMVAAIQAWRPQVDTIVVYLHWGESRVGCATPRQEELAGVLAAAGADVIVGAHSHVLEGGGHLGTAFVDYGLGNFAFYNGTGEYGRSGVLMLSVTGRDVDSYQWIPAQIQSGGGVATPLPAGPGADAEVAHWNELRACTNLTP